MRRPGGGVPGEIETRGYVTNIHYSLWGFFFFSLNPPSDIFRRLHVGAPATKFLLLSLFL